MLQYIPFKEYKKGKFLYRLWNGEFKRTYPISAYLFKERILNDINFDVNNSYVALYERMPIGFILIKKWQDDSLFYSIPHVATISLFYVEKDVRNMGVGTELLSLAMDGLKKDPNIKALQLGNDLLSLFPGLPNEFNKTTPFLINRGFKSKDGCVDMIQIIHKNHKDLSSSIQTPKELHTRIATEEDKDLLLKLCLDNNLIKEAYLIKRYFENGGTGRRIVLGLIDNQIIGFVRIYDKKRNITRVNFFLDRAVGSLSTMGIDKKYQEGQYAEKLCLEAMNYLILRGCKKIMIEKTQNTEFYKKLGFKAFKYYLGFEKEINKDVS